MTDDDRPARVPQQRRLGLVFLESEAALGPWGWKLAQDAVVYVRDRRKKSYNKMKGLLEMEPIKERVRSLVGADPQNGLALAATTSSELKEISVEKQAANGPIAGIDPGIEGAVALLSPSGDLLAVHDLPVLPDGPAGRRRVNPALLAVLLAKTHASHAYCELVNSRPNDGHMSAFSFGMTRGLLEGCLAALSIPVTMIAPPSWKRCIGLAPGKENAKALSRAEACRRWPAHAALFARVRDNGRSDACLIALAGLMGRRA
jgi:crossover junction endodeoxyribonuclease RuvC